jgi:hypothetical protein
VKVEADPLIEGPGRADGSEDIATFTVLLPGFDVAAGSTSSSVKPPFVR